MAVDAGGVDVVVLNQIQHHDVHVHQRVIDPADVGLRGQHEAGMLGLGFLGGEVQRAAVCIHLLFVIGAPFSAAMQPDDQWQGRKIVRLGFITCRDIEATERLHAACAGHRIPQIVLLLEADGVGGGEPAVVQAGEHGQHHVDGGIVRGPEIDLAGYV